MLHPAAPVESIPPSRFHPPFCPKPHCPRHRRVPGAPCFYTRKGFYTRKCDRRRIQEFRCKTCGGRFSQQSFAWSYYLKRPRLGPDVAALLNSGCAHRQIARTLGCAASTVTRLSAHLGARTGMYANDRVDHTVAVIVVLGEIHAGGFGGDIGVDGGDVIRKT